MSVSTSGAALAVCTCIVVTGTLRMSVYVLYLSSECTKSVHSIFMLLKKGTTPKYPKTSHRKIIKCNTSVIENTRVFLFVGCVKIVDIRLYRKLKNFINAVFCQKWTASYSWVLFSYAMVLRYHMFYFIAVDLYLGSFSFVIYACN